MEKVNNESGRAGKCDEDNDPVEYLEVVLARLLFPAVQPDSEQDAEGAAVTGQSLEPGELKWTELKREKDAKGVLPYKLWLVENDMTQTRADNGCHHHINREGIDVAFRFAFLAIHVIQDLLADEKAQRKKQPVPAKFK